MKKRNRYTKKQRIRNRRILAIVLVLIYIIVLIAAFNVKPKARIPTHYISYTVEEGDRLWTIAREIWGDSCDIRYKIDDIEKLNGISGGRIYEGQVLRIGV